MRLYHWRGSCTNFGDELNRLLWPRLLPGFFDDDPSTLFLGIGSVLDVRHDASAVKLVAGAGYGGYEPPPVPDARWIVHWVRGPRTARSLGIPTEAGLGDPAMLLATPRGDGRRIGFMPHFESLSRGAWAEAAALAGLTLIDPRDDPAAIITAIGDCRVVLGEAMHAVIVADAMRVPWVALRPLAWEHRAKWLDWAETLDLQVQFRALDASSLPEWLHCKPLSGSHHGRRMLGRAKPALQGVARKRFIDCAARSLAAAAAGPAQLSGDVSLDRCRSRLLERVEALRRDPMRPAPWRAAAGRSPLG